MTQARDLADGKFDTNTLVVDASANKVGIGTASPATAELDVSGKIRSSSGVLFGTDTADANLLDDYEEGTWTPTYDSGYPGGSPEEVNAGCQYVKVGKIVHITGKIEARNDGTTMQLGGLPFAVASSSSASCSVSHNSHTARKERLDAGTSVIRWVFSGTSSSLENQFFAATYVTS